MTRCTPAPPRTSARLPFQAFDLCGAVVLVPRYLPAALTERRGDVTDRPEQNQGIIPGRLEASPPPEFGGFTIDGIDQQGPSADQQSGLNAALEGMFHKAGPDAHLRPPGVGRELAEEHAWDWVGRLPCPDRPRQNRRHNGSRREAVVSDHAAGLMHDENRGEPLLLIGEGARLQPVVKRGFATGELGHIVFGGERFGTRKEQEFTASPRNRAPMARAASGPPPSPERERPDAPAHP